MPVLRQHCALQRRGAPSVPHCVWGQHAASVVKCCSVKHTAGCICLIPLPACLRDYLLCSIHLQCCRHHLACVTTPQAFTSASTRCLLALAHLSFVNWVAAVLCCAVVPRPRGPLHTAGAAAGCCTWCATRPHHLCQPLQAPRRLQVRSCICPAGGRVRPQPLPLQHCWMVLLVCQHGIMVHERCDSTSAQSHCTETSNAH